MANVVLGDELGFLRRAFVKPGRVSWRDGQGVKRRAVRTLSWMPGSDEDMLLVGRADGAWEVSRGARAGTLHSVCAGSWLYDMPTHDGACANPPPVRLAGLHWLPQSAQLVWGTSQRRVFTQALTTSSSAALAPGKLRCVYTISGPKPNVQSLDVLRVCPGDESRLLIAGHELDPRLIQLQAPAVEAEQSSSKGAEADQATVVFAAKNSKHDSLDMRVPVVIRDAVFLSESPSAFAACTKDMHVRVYDARAQRRPTALFQLGKSPHTSLTSVPGRPEHIILGNAVGDIWLVDLRQRKQLGRYRGPAGSVRSLQVHPTAPLLASTGRDRFMRVHDLNSRKLLARLYVKQQGNAVLWSSDEPADSDDEVAADGGAETPGVDAAASAGSEGDAGTDGADADDEWVMLDSMRGDETRDEDVSDDGDHGDDDAASDDNDSDDDDDDDDDSSDDGDDDDSSEEFDLDADEQDYQAARAADAAAAAPLAGRKRARHQDVPTGRSSKKARKPTGKQRR